MRQRGWKYWEWREKRIRAVRSEQILKGGLVAETHIALASDVTLIFIGVYEKNGVIVSEETYATDHQSHDVAHAWAISMANYMTHKLDTDL